MLRLNSTIDSEKLQLLSAIMYSIICVRVFLKICSLLLI